MIYIGKSKVLKASVSQYFAERVDESPKTRRMIANVSDFEYILVDSKWKRSPWLINYKPRYNIRLKDDKLSVYCVTHRGLDDCHKAATG